MGYARSLNYPGRFEFNLLRAEVIEQSNTVTEQDGRQVDPDFVQQAQLQALLCDTRAAYTDILIPCGFLCLTNGAFNAIRDESEGRPFLDPFLWDGMSDDKTRSTAWGVATPRIGDVEHPPSRHHRPKRGPFLSKEFGAGA